MKFKVGEIAILVKNPTWSTCNLTIGDEVTIKKIGPVKGRNESGLVSYRDYLINDEYGDCWAINESKLRKRRPPEEPAEKWFQDDLRDLLGNRKDRKVTTKNLPKKAVEKIDQP